MRRKAISAEINKFPDACRINRQQAKFADDALVARMVSKFNSGELRAEALQAISDPANAPPQEVCGDFRTLLKEDGSIGSFVGDISVEKFIQSMKYKILKSAIVALLSEGERPKFDTN